VRSRDAENNQVLVCTCGGELISLFNDWVCEREGEMRVRVKFECCKCGLIAVVRVLDAEEDQ
jgi:hypothetical protein